MTRRIEKVTTGRLKVDPQYQRRLNDKRVARMAASWSDDLAQVLDVSARNGSWYVLDGQHRLAAARAAGVAELSALVYDDLSPAEEADLFVRLNTLRTRPSTNDLFRARLEAGEEAALAVVRAVTEAGAVIDTSSGSNRRPEVTRAVGAFLAVYEAGGERLVRETVSTLRKAWPEDQHALEAGPIYGVAGFIAAYRDHPRYEFARISQKLGELPTSVYLRRSVALGESSFGTASGQGGIQKAGPRRAVLEAFNRDLRGRRIPDATQAELRAITRGGNPWSGKETE